MMGWAVLTFPTRLRPPTQGVGYVVHTIRIRQVLYQLIRAEHGSVLWFAVIISWLSCLRRRPVVFLHTARRSALMPSVRTALTHCRAPRRVAPRG
jgi:hypothetical protein